MLYVILKPVVKASLRLYFRRINKDGLRQIDNGKATLILANHTASFMDAILVACFVHRRIHFFARGDVFKNKWADKVLRSIGLLPVYRLSEGRDKLHLNDGSNEEALAILRRGGAVLIFCEGSSDIAKRLKPLKKGPFRLTANAAATLPEAPVIVPLGINYVTPTMPGGDVFMVAGEPMSSRDFIEETSENALAKAATTMMRQTEAALKPLVWHATSQEHELLADKVLLEAQAARPECSFEEMQYVMHRLNGGEGREVLQELSGESDRRPRKGFWMPLQLVLIPFAFIGRLFHFLPLSLAGSITRKKVVSPDFQAPVFLSCALLLTLAWYLAWLVTGWLLGAKPLYYLLLLLVAGSGILYLRLFGPNHEGLFWTTED